MPDPKPLATFTKDGKTRHAFTRADVVKFRFEGWQEKTPTKSASKPPAKKASPKKAAASKPPAGNAAGTTDPPTPQ